MTKNPLPTTNSNNHDATAATQNDDDDDEIPWTDDRIRWVEDFQKEKNKPDDDDEEEEEEEEEVPFLDPFADPHPMQTFDFAFATTDNNDDNQTKIHVTVQGYKRNADAVWQSTGLTLWKAAEFLCRYLVQHQERFVHCQCDILELGAGLGLCGLVAHLLGATHVCITDGDTDAL